MITDPQIADLHSEYHEGDFIFCNFFRQISEVGETSSRFGHCTRLCERVAERIRAIGYQARFLTADTFHVGLEIKIEGRLYYFDPLFLQKKPLLIDEHGDSGSFEPDVRVQLHPKVGGFTAKKMTSVTERSYSFNLHRTSDCSRGYTLPTDMKRSSELPDTPKIIFYSEDKKHTLSTEDGNYWLTKVSRKGKEKTEITEKQLEAIDKKVNLPRGTFRHILMLAIERGHG